MPSIGGEANDNVPGRLHRQAVQDQILQMAECLLRQHGLSKLTVRDIAALLHMSPSNIYNFFPDKAAVIESLGDRAHEVLRQGVTAAVTSCLAPWQKIEQSILFIHLTLRQQCAFAPEIFGLILLGEKECRRFSMNFDRFLRASMVQALRSLHNARNLDVESLTQAILDCLHFALSPALIQAIPPGEHYRRILAQLEFIKRCHNEFDL